jgi:hypothetical protein
MGQPGDPRKIVQIAAPIARRIRNGIILRQMRLNLTPSIPNPDRRYKA